MATYYCDIENGNDTTGTGSSGNPYKTLSKGLSVISTNDTLILAPSDTTDYDAAYKSMPAGATVKCLTKPNLQTSTYARINGAGTYQTWSLTGDFTCENIVFYNFNSGSGSVIYTGNFTASLQTITINDCIVDSCQSSYSSAGRGGFLGNGGSVANPAQASIVVNFNRCLIHNFREPSGYTASTFISTVGTSKYDINFHECTFYNPASGDELDNIYTTYNAGDVPYFRNCIIYTDQTVPLNICKDSSGNYKPSIMTNCVYYGVTTTSATITNSVNADPKFLDKTNKDFRLQSSSPAIDAGLAV